jgi:hypothetical protein
VKMMGKYAVLKKEFEFLARDYGFEINMTQKHGAYYFIIWANPNKKIMVIYDEQVNEKPISIRVYDADSFSFDAIEYKDEFDQSCGTPREKIRRAAVWLGSAIADRSITV